MKICQIKEKFQIEPKRIEKKREYIYIDIQIQQMRVRKRIKK